MSSAPISLHIGRSDWILLLVLATIWGGSFLFIEILVAELKPFTIVAGRMILGAAAILLFMRLRGLNLKFPLKVWKALAVMAIMGHVIPITLVVWSQIYITASLASILNATPPFFTVLAAHFFTSDERLKSSRLIGVLIGFIGVSVIIGPKAWSGIGDEIWGEIGMLVASMCYAFVAIYGRRFRTMGVPAISAAGGQMILSALMLVPLALYFDHPWEIQTLSPQAIFAFLALGFLSTGVAFAMYFHLLARVGATNTVLVTFLSPVSAIFLGSLFLGENLALWQAAGLLIMGVGLACIDGRLLARFTPRNP